MVNFESSGQPSSGLLTILDDKLHFSLALNRSKIASVYVRESDYTYYEDAFALNPIIDKFYRVENIEEGHSENHAIVEVFDEETNTTVRQLDLSSSPLVVYIRLDGRVDMFEMSGVSLPAMLSQVGGFFSIVFTFGRIVVYFFAKDRFWGSLIEILFRIKEKPSMEER